MRPQVGDIVHYWPGPDSYGNPQVGPWAALVLAVQNDRGVVMVTAFPPDGSSLQVRCPFVESRSRGVTHICSPKAEVEPG